MERSKINIHVRVVVQYRLVRPLSGTIPRMRHRVSLPTARVVTSGRVVAVPLSVRPPAVAAALDRVGCTMLVLGAVGALFGDVGVALLDFTVDGYDGAAGGGTITAREGAIPFLRAACAAVAQHAGSACSLSLTPLPQ